MKTLLRPRVAYVYADGPAASLEEASKNLVKLFDDNLMNSNPNKCYLIEKQLPRGVL